jgi:Na+/H+ antiporter NhaD/arsenite permease-like protein
MAISAGAVLMGANTYIGNGPNFMVKAIADSQGYKTDSFGAYALKAVTLLLPIYVVVALYVSGT